MIPLPAARFLAVQPTVELVFGLARPDRACTVVQLVAAHAGDGTTAMARDLALVAAGPAGLRTVLVAVELAAAGNWPGGLMNPARIGAPDPAGLQQVSDSRLMLGLLPAGAAPTAWLDQLRAWRGGADLIVLDLPALDRSAAAVTLAQHVDTTLLVAAAEVTTMSALGGLRDRLRAAGGTIKGVLFNRQRQHLPRMLAGVL